MPVDLNMPVNFTKCYQCDLHFRIPVVSGMFKCPRCGFPNKRRSALGDWRLASNKRLRQNSESLFEMAKRLPGCFEGGKKR